MTYNIKDVKAITPEFVAKLAVVNVHTTDDLFKIVKDPTTLKTFTEKVGVEPTMMDRLYKIAQFTKLDGLALPHAELLVLSGIDSVEKLAAQKPEMLLTKLTEVKMAQKLTTELPTVSDMAKWVTAIPAAELTTAR